MRHFANVALKEKEKELNSQCFGDAELKMKPAASESMTVNVKKYDDIPGPTGIFGIGTFYQYFPIFGKQIAWISQSKNKIVHTKM